MNTRSSICNVGSRTSSGESDEESYLIEEKLQKLLTYAGSQDGPKNIFNRITEVPRLRRSIMARAVQKNIYCSTPMPTNKKLDFHENTSYVSPINSASEEVDPIEAKKSEDSEKNQELPNELKQPANRNSIISLSDSEDEELEQNEPVNKRRHAEVVNCTVDECTKTSENGGNKENLPNNSRNTSISATKAKNQKPNTTNSKHITSLGSEAVNKNVSGSKSSKTIADDQTNGNVLPGRLLRSQNCTFIKDNHTDIAPPNLRKNKKNFKKNKTQNDGTDFSQRNISESLPGVSRSGIEIAVETIISPAKTFIDEESETSVKENSHQTNVAKIIPTKHITEDTKVTKKLEERLQISPTKLSSTSKESPGILVADKNEKTRVPVAQPVIILSRIPVARSRSKSKEKDLPNKETDSSETKNGNEHVRITENSGHLAKSPPKRPPRKKRIPKETKTGNVPKMAVEDPVSTDFAEIPLKRNRVEKSVDPLKVNATQNEKSVENKRDNQIKSNEENKLVETGTSPIRIFNKNVKKHAKDKELSKCNSFNHDRNMFPTLTVTKAQELDEKELKIQMINKEVQTSAKSTKKNRTKRSRKALTFDRNNSNQSSSTDSSTIIQNFEDERIVLFQTLEPNDLSINFSSSDDELFEDTLCKDEGNRPWRLDDDLQIFPRRSSCKLNFLRTAQEIELEKESEKLDQSNNISDNREKISTPLPQSGVQDCTKKNRLQVYSRATLHNNNSNISQTTRLQPSESDNVETSLITNQVSNKEGPKISEIKTRSKYLQVDIQKLDARRTKGPDLVVMQPISEQEQTITDCNGEKNRVTNTRGKTNKKDHEEEVLAVPLDNTNPHPTSTKSLHVEIQTLDVRKIKSPDLFVMQPISEPEKTFTDSNGERNRVINTRGKPNKKDHEEEALAVALDSTNPQPTSTIKKTNKKQNKVSRSTNKTESSTNKRVLRSNRKTFDQPLEEVQQPDDVLAAPLERSIPHLNCTDSISVKATDKNEENSDSEIRSQIEKSHSGSAKKQSSNCEPNHVRTSDILRNVDCVQDEVQNTSPPDQEASLNMPQPTNIAQNQMIPPTSINNEDRPSSFKSPPPKKAAKTTKPRRKKVISENDEGVSSTTTVPEDVAGVRRSRRERKVIERNYEGRVATYNEREYVYFNGKITGTVNESIKPKSKKKDSTKNKKSEGVSAKKGKRGKKDIEKPQVSSQNRRKKQSNDEMSTNSLGNDQAEENINSNNMESNVNMADEINHTLKRSVKDVIVSSAKKHSRIEDPVSQNVTPPKKRKTTYTGRDFQENNNTSIRINDNRMQQSINSKSPVRVNNADHTETDNDVNAYGTSNDFENLNYEDFVPPSMLPQGGNRQVEKDSGRSTMLRSTFEESSLRITKPLTGRITKSHKKKNNICTKISKVLSRSMNTSKEQELLNGRNTNTVALSEAVNIAQDLASRRSSILQLKPSNGEYINLMSDVNLISMRYVDTLPKFKLVKDNLLVTEGLRNLKDGGTMGYLKLLPAGQKSLHVARKFALFYFVMEGEGFLQVHNKTSSINKYSTFLIPLGVEYSITNTSKVDELFLGFVKMSSREDS